MTTPLAHNAQFAGKRIAIVEHMQNHPFVSSPDGAARRLCAMGRGDAGSRADAGVAMAATTPSTRMKDFTGPDLCERNVRAISLSHAIRTHH